MTPARSPFFAYVRPAQPARLRLLCFPYAAGSASVFREWQALVPPGVEVWPVQYPGRETRWGEPLCREMGELVRPLQEALQPHLEVPVVFFGHSLGALIAFELARSLEAEGTGLPVHVVLSACGAPQDEHGIGDIDRMSDEEIIQRLRALQGIPEAALENQELLQAMLPVIRADMALARGYRCEERPPLRSPVTVLGGLSDTAVPQDALAGWARHSAQFLGVKMFRGNHFFLRGQEHLVLASVLGPVSHLLG